MIDLNEYKSDIMPVEVFLNWHKPYWAKGIQKVCVNFKVWDEKVSHKYVSVGTRPPTCFEGYKQDYPGKFIEVDGIGGLMGVLMDLSLQFNLCHVVARQSFNFIEYTTWMERTGDGASNIDADMVEKFSMKVCEK